MDDAVAMDTTVAESPKSVNSDYIPFHSYDDGSTVGSGPATVAVDAASLPGGGADHGRQQAPNGGASNTTTNVDGDVDGDASRTNAYMEWKLGSERDGGSAVRGQS